MANLNNPHGLRVLLALSGGPIQTMPFSKAATLAQAIFPGDAVAGVNDGSITPAITPGTSLYYGVALDYGAASKATSHQVVIGLDTVYEAQGDGSNGGTGFAQADMGLNCNLSTSVAGSTVTLLSGMQLAESSKAVTSTLDVKLLQLQQIPNNAFGSYARIEVTFNKHRMAPGVAGV
jgi:hypothetical protein